MPEPPIAKEAQGQSFASLRLGLTPACNYACVYCVSGPGGHQKPRRFSEEHWQFLAKVVTILVREQGITKVRLTGGEPLISPFFFDCARLLERLGCCWSVTTNGSLLAKSLGQLAPVRPEGINISLDSLDERRFAEITRGGKLEEVLQGIERALAAGLKVKINFVPMKGVNDDEICRAISFANQKGMEIRFIELMDMGVWHENPDTPGLRVGMKEILARAEATFGRFSELPRKSRSTSLGFRNRSGMEFGVIANSSRPFCADCDRLRLTQDARLYGCISDSRSYDLTRDSELDYRDLSRKLEQTILPLCLGYKKKVRFVGERISMSAIGG